MGHLKDITNQSKLHTFPGATFEAKGDVPLPQCSEALIQGDDAITISAPKILDPTETLPPANALAGKICHITASVGGNTGNFLIASNTMFDMTLTTDPGDGDPVTYYISDGGELILPQTAISLAAYIYTAGYAYTFKGGKLFTDMPSAQLQNACKILFDPLT